MGEEISEEVQRIIRTKDLYEVLQVERTCSSDDLKRSYRKIAVKVHPDRCKDPKATEAFQKVSHAYQTLSDENKRKNYDEFGDERPQPQFNNAYGANTRYYYQGDIDPNDLFRAFFDDDIFGFGSPFGFTRFYYQGQQAEMNQRRRRRREEEPRSWASLLFVFAPFLFMFLLSVLPNILMPKPKDRFRIELEKVIDFPPADEDVTEDPTSFSYKSYKYKRNCIIPKTWRNQMVRAYFSSNQQAFYSTLYRTSDVIFEDWIRAKCKQEKHSSSKPSCVEMKAYHIKA